MFMYTCVCSYKVDKVFKTLDLVDFVLLCQMLKNKEKGEKGTHFPVRQKVQ